MLKIKTETILNFGKKQYNALFFNVNCLNNDFNLLKTYIDKLYVSNILDNIICESANYINITNYIENTQNNLELLLQNYQNIYNAYKILKILNILEELYNDINIFYNNNEYCIRLSIFNDYIYNIEELINQL